MHIQSKATPKEGEAEREREREKIVNYTLLLASFMVAQSPSHSSNRFVAVVEYRIIKIVFGWVKNLYIIFSINHYKNPCVR